MKILITGGAGFIGRHLAERLLEQGHSVDVLDPKFNGHLPGTTQLSNTCQDFFGRPKEDWPSWFGDWDFIYHLAATLGVRRVLEDPAACIENNIESLRAVLRLGIPGLFTSTSEIYGRTEPVLREDSPILYSSKSRWSYAASKLIGEWMCQQAPGWKAVRLFNVVGPRQSAGYGAVLPKFVSQAASNENITVYGSGEQVRTFIDVRDCVEILDELRDKDFDVVNVGGTTVMDMRHLANRVKFELDSDSHVVNVPYEAVYPDGFEECPSRIPDLSKLNTLIAPRTNIQFRKTILDLAKEIRYEPVCR